MMNRRELELVLENLKAEYMEALERGNKRIQNNIVNQILNLEVTLKEDEFKNLYVYLLKEVKLNEEVEFDFDEKEVFRQQVILNSFSKKLKELYKKHYNTTTAQISTRQAETIMAGLRDRVGMDIDAKQIEFINNLTQIKHQK